MASILTSALVALAEVSHVFSLVSIIGVGLFMFLFILRLIRHDIQIMDHFERGGVTRVVQGAPPQIAVQRVALPFHLRLASPVSRVTLEHVPLVLTGLAPVTVTMRVGYGVDIATYHHILRSPWHWFREAFLRGLLFGSEGCAELAESQAIDLPDPAPVLYTLPPMQSPAIDLGHGSPRQKYPIILCSLTGLEGPEDIGAVFQIIHIQDEVCRLPTQILATTVKQCNGLVTHLQPIFHSDAFQDDEFQCNICVVCQERPISRVTLPCKHACVCARCYQRLLARCPMCRSQIDAYFLIRTEAEFEPDEPLADSPPTRPRTWRDLWDDWNHRFALATGLQQNF